MTLCIARRVLSLIRVVSDSRVSFGGSLPPLDAGVKISSLRATVYPWRETGKPDAPDLDEELGIAVIGSHTTSAVVRELLRALFSSLQYPAGFQTLSLAGICDLARGLFEHVSGSVCSVLARDGLSQFLLVGWCPASQSQRAFLFKIDASAFPISAAYDEVLKDSNPLFLGSGATTAEGIYFSRPGALQFHVLKQVIDDPSVPTVGGAIQCGEIRERDFQLRGVEDYVVDHAAKTIAVQFCVAGFPVLRAPLSGGMYDFPYRQAFLQPFRDEINTYMDAGYRVV